MTDRITCVAPMGDRCGEGAIWSAREQAIYWVDLMRFLVHRLDWASGSVRSWHFDEPVVALSLTTDPDRILVALASRLIYWWPQTDIRRDQGFRLDGYPRVRLNDGRTDPLGNFWVGSMRNNLDADAELGEAGPARECCSVSPRMAPLRGGGTILASPTPSAGVRIGIASTLPTPSKTKSMSMTSIDTTVQFETSANFSRATLVACLMAPRSTAKDSCGIAASVVDA